MILDVVGKAQVKIGDAEQDGSKSNALEGNNALGFDVELGQKKGNWQYFVVAGAEYDMESVEKLKGRSGPGKNKKKAHYDYNAGANVQYQANEKVFILAGVNAEFEPKVKYKNSSEKDDAQINLNYKVGANYVVNKDMLLNFGYQLSDVKSKDVRNWALSTVSASALYQF
jgi:opacity protein-like surface antigen